MTDLDKFFKKRAIQEKAENYKLAVVIFLVLSVIAFEFIGKSIVKEIIWYWVGLMVVLLIIALVQDFLNWRKIKRLGL